jgi:fatty-acyl-CoA synthase
VRNVPMFSRKERTDVMDTVVEAIREGKGIVDRGFTFLDHNLDPKRLSYDDVSKEADTIGRYYRLIGLKRGDRVALMLPDNKDFVLWFLGAVTAGVVPVPIYPPMPGGRLESFLDRTSKILNSCKARCIVTSRLMTYLEESLKKGVPVLDNVIYSEDVSTNEKGVKSEFLTEEKIAPSDICFIQYTSGSTRDPKGVIVTHQNVIANALSMIDIIELNVEKDVGACWLPLYHDMGLIGSLLAPTLAHSNMIFMSPFTFVTRPESWIKVINEYRVTVAASPNFGLALATKYANRAVEVDLSCLREITCGGEPIHPDTVRSFIDTFKPLGLSDIVIKPAYGMAEATLCVTMTKLDERFRTVLIDKEKYELENKVIVVENGKEKSTLEIVSCGNVIIGHEIDIVNEKYESLGEGKVGEIVVRGPSVTGGYYGDSESSAKLFCGDWIITGDLGFVLNEELFVSGRRKDLIVVAGRNYHPHSIEWCVEQVDGVRPGNVVAFSIDNKLTERVVVVAEIRDSVAPAPVQLANTVKTRVAADFGIPLHEVVFVEKGSLPKTSSGKLQRGKAKSWYEGNTLRRIPINMALPMT